jgi:hypothetical protein
MNELPPRIGSTIRIFEHFKPNTQNPCLGQNATVRAKEFGIILATCLLCGNRGVIAKNDVLGKNSIPL